MIRTVGKIVWAVGEMVWKVGKMTYCYLAKADEVIM